MLGVKEDPDNTAQSNVTSVCSRITVAQGMAWDLRRTVVD